jgi:2-(1,2-epoxy-1,2-dihydrophenyl)acetyl-CoA isomerase
VSVSYEHLIVERDEAVVTLTLNRPERLNAFNEQTKRELLLALAQIAEDSSARALVLTGAGRGFCSGADARDTLSSLPAGPGLRQHLQFAHRIVSAIFELEKPVVAAVNGVAAGAGLSLALACDVLLASDQARFSQIFVKRGLVPDLGSLYFLPRLIGLQRARALMLTAEVIDAAEADRLGLVYRVVPAAELLPAARNLARRMAANAPRAVGLTKALVNRSLETDYRTMLELEALAQATVSNSADYREAIAAFLEKREPRFSGD